MSLRTRVRNRIVRVRDHRWRMRAWTSPERHIVIGGCPRSGTTLLRRTLDAHPAICCGPETSLFLPGRVALGPLAAGYGIPEAELRTLRATSPSQGAFVDAVAERYRALRGRERWAEKTPLNIRHLAWILERWPEARIIHVVRDGRDVVCSLRTHAERRWVDGRWVKVPPPERPVAEWARRWLADTAAGLALRSDPRVLTVRYEDLARTPETEVARVLAFLGEAVVPDLLAIEESAADARPDAAGPVSTRSIGRWRSDLSAAEQAEVLRVAGARLRELGYLDADAA
ncbi:MAG: sulfotransferase family protein [Chloroflexota bacterium]